MPIQGQRAIDLLAVRPNQKVAIEVETGKSNIAANIEKLQADEYDRIVVVATSAQATTTCQKVITKFNPDTIPIELLTWLDIS